jgi:hypothetical protein
MGACERVAMQYLPDAPATSTVVGAASATGAHSPPTVPHSSPRATSLRVAVTPRTRSVTALSSSTASAAAEGLERPTHQRRRPRDAVYDVLA